MICVAEHAPTLRGTTRLPQFLLRGFWDELQRRGVSVGELARTTGLTPPKEHDYLSSISLEEMHRLFAAGVAASGDEQLGLSVGRALGASSFHLLSMIVLASSTLEHAISAVARAEPQVAGLVPQLRELDDGRIRFGLPRAPTSTTGARVEADIAGVLLYETALLFLDPKHGLPSMEFPFAAPRDRRAYERAFSEDVRFGGEGVFCTFAKSALRRRSGVDRQLQKELFHLAQEQYGARIEHERWPARVRRVLQAHPAPRLLDARAVAEQLEVSQHTLARRLAQERTSFSCLMDEVLYERAQACLGRGATNRAGCGGARLCRAPLLLSRLSSLVGRGHAGRPTAIVTLDEDAAEPVGGPHGGDSESEHEPRAGA